MSDATQRGHDKLVSSLARYLSAQAGAPVDVKELTRISNGWESDVYAFDAPAWREGGHVLRLYFGPRAAATALHEFRALQVLAHAGYPVPLIDLVEPSAHPLGRAFLIMERVDGSPLGNRWKQADTTVRQSAADLFCRLFVDLHTLPWQHLPMAHEVPTLSIAQQLGSWRDFAARNPSDALETAISWLLSKGNQVNPQPLGLVHWDFHHENILINEADNYWVIDWTQFQATDVRFDLGWTLVLLASERDLATSQEVRAGYAMRRGWDEMQTNQEMEFFEAAACAKRLILVLFSLNYGADSIGMRPGADTIIRSRLSRIALLYQRWLTLSGTPLAELEELLAEHL